MMNDDGSWLRKEAQPHRTGQAIALVHTRTKHSNSIMGLECLSTELPCVCSALVFTPTLPLAISVYLFISREFAIGEFISLANDDDKNERV